jgi:hypothetical protein
MGSEKVLDEVFGQFYKLQTSTASLCQSAGFHMNSTFAWCRKEMETRGRVEKQREGQIKALCEDFFLLNLIVLFVAQIFLLFMEVD